MNFMRKKIKAVVQIVTGTGEYHEGAHENTMQTILWGLAEGASRVIMSLLLNLCYDTCINVVHPFQHFQSTVRHPS